MTARMAEKGNRIITLNWAIRSRYTVEVPQLQRIFYFSCLLWVSIIIIILTKTKYFLDSRSIPELNHTKIYFPHLMKALAIN